MTRTDVCALYQFVPVADPPGVREALLAEMNRLEVRGSLLVAPEGINGTIAGCRHNLQSILDRIAELLDTDPIDAKWSTCEDTPFRRTKVRLKREIVTMGVDHIDPTSQAGTYVDAEDWNALVDDPNVIVIDTRNEYEIELGKFRGAIDPKTESFREFPAYVKDQLDPRRHAKVAMYCTGGIRCEKATSLLKSAGFDEVYHLRGGILKYLETVSEGENRFEGDCYVFDGRVAVDNSLQPTGHAMCHACGLPVAPEQLDDPDYRVGVHCPRCVETLTEDQRSRFEMRQRQMAKET